MRKPIFDAIRDVRGTGFTAAEVNMTDALLDSLGIARDTQAGRTISKKGIALIKQFEGCKLAAYPDPGTGGDPWTIGWGATGPGIKKGVVWTQAQADARLEQDVQKFSDGVVALLETAPTTQGQFEALVSFAYNVGLGNIGSSTLLRLHKAGDYAGAAAEFAKWRFAAGKELPGLVKRRAAEAALYRGQA